MYNQFCLLLKYPTKRYIYNRHLDPDPGDPPAEVFSYKWIVVSVPYLLRVQILCRDVSAFNSGEWGREESAEGVVKHLVEQRAFKNFWNKPRKTYHGDKCIYN